MTKFDSDFATIEAAAAVMDEYDHPLADRMRVVAEALGHRRNEAMLRDSLQQLDEIEHRKRLEALQVQDCESRVLSDNIGYEPDEVLVGTRTRGFFLTASEGEPGKP
jgi:hypothetical protein